MLPRPACNHSPTGPGRRVAWARTFLNLRGITPQGFETKLSSTNVHPCTAANTPARMAKVVAKDSVQQRILFAVVSSPW